METIQQVTERLNTMADCYLAYSKAANDLIMSIDGRTVTKEQIALLDKYNECMVRTAAILRSTAPGNPNQSGNPN